MKLQITDSPTIEHVGEIKRWLEEENNLSKEGFYCNWELIKRAFENKRLIIITENGNAIGFLTFFINGFIAEIGIAEIKPDERTKGVGKELVKKSSDYFIENGALVAELFCSPEKSEKIWKKMGFINFPDGVIKDSRIYLYKILVPSLDFSEDDSSKEIIELWNEDDHLAVKLAPKWRWEIKREKSSNKLIYPLIHPASDEWPVCFREGTKIKEKRIMKNFNKGINEHGYFLIINELDRF